MTYLLTLAIGLCVGFIVGLVAASAASVKIITRTRLTLWLVHTSRDGERLLRIECDSPTWPVPERVIVGRMVERGATDAEVRAVKRLRTITTKGK